MKYHDFKYVDVAVNGQHNRNKLCDMTLLGDPTGKPDTFMTYFRYDDEMAIYFKNNVLCNSYGKHYKSVKGFKGRAYVDWIPIDIDAPNLEEAQFQAQQLIQTMEGYDIDTEACRYYFSGSKGFHIMIPSGMAGVEPSADIDKRIKAVVESVTVNINVDPMIYDKVRLLRIPNTIHSKSRLFKIGLYSFEIMSMSPGRILELAKEPREELEIEEDYDQNEFLTEMYESYIDTPKINTNNSAVKVRHCMQTIQQGGFKEGENGGRNNIGMRVVDHLKESGLSEKMILSALEEWSETNEPPFDSDELVHVYNQGMKYDFGCRDPIKAAHCNPDCLFYKKEWNRF
jgi:hypothetical protein